MISNCIENPTYLLAFDLDLSERNHNSSTTPKEFIERFLTSVPFCKEEDEHDIIMADVVLTALFTIMAFIEKKMVKGEMVYIDEDLYKEFKAFYKILATAETKISFTSDYLPQILSILSSVSCKIEKMLELSIHGTTKKILDVMYVNSKTEVKADKVHLYLVLQIKTQ